MIAGFTTTYPKIRIIVTSRIVGYKNKVLEDAGFIHFTIQDFDNEQINTFLDRWYSVVLENQEEIAERKERIFKALKESSSIQQLVGNPLLLTILAIIGKRQDLPSERWELYDHAASVLVEHWDVNKHLMSNNINASFIGGKEKKELLMRIAFKMQSSPKGLAGNFIHRLDLQREIEEYIIYRFRESPRNAKIIAKSIINQLRERNFILCLYDADSFSFIHRTFLEYFCAMDITTKFDNHELDIEVLKKEYYEKYWEDPTWHEVLRLICGMKDKFAENIIECLMEIYDPQFFGNRPPENISLAIKCFSELRNPYAIDNTAKRLLQRIFKLFEMVRWTQDIISFLASEILPSTKIVGPKWSHKDLIADQFVKSQVYINYPDDLFLASFDSTFISYLGDKLFLDDVYLRFIYGRIDLNLNDIWAEFISIIGSNSEMLYNSVLSKISNSDESRLLAVLTLGKYTPKEKQVLSLFSALLEKEKNTDVRRAVVQELARGWHDSPETFNLIKNSIINDNDSSVREAAVQELAHWWYDSPETFTLIIGSIRNDSDSFVRRCAVQELARRWHDFPETLSLIKEEITKDKDNFVRSTAVRELARGWHDLPETLSLIKEKITKDNDNFVRSTAVRELARGWHEDSETLTLIIEQITNDKDYSVRCTAVRELANGWHDFPETLSLITLTLLI